MRRPSCFVNSGVKWTTFNRIWSVQLLGLMALSPRRRETIKSMRLKKHHQGLSSLYKSDREVRDSTSKRQRAFILRVHLGTPRQNFKPSVERTEQVRLSQCM